MALDENELMDSALLASATDVFSLGQMISEPIAVSGGYVNSVWRIATIDGEFAVKVLSDGDDSPTHSYRYDDAFRLEQAAIRQGIYAPTPVANPASGGPLAQISDSQGRSHRVLIHSWFDAHPLEPGVVKPKFAFAVGELLGNIHSIKLNAPRRAETVSAAMPGENELRAIADAAFEQGVPWATSLQESLEAVATACNLVGTLNPAALPQVFTHGDINHKNLLNLDGKPVLVDWETADYQPIAYELASTALSLADEGFATFNKDVLSAIFAGYQTSSPTLPHLGKECVAAKLSGTTRFTLFNIERTVKQRDDDPCIQQRTDSIIPKLLNEIRDFISNFDRTVASLENASRTQ